MGSEFLGKWGQSFRFLGKWGLYSYTGCHKSQEFGVSDTVDWESEKQGVTSLKSLG